MVEIKVKGRINRGDNRGVEKMVKSAEEEGRGECKCAEHSGVVTKQRDRDGTINGICGELKEVKQRLEQKIRWNTFTWVIGTLLLILLASAGLYGQSIDREIEEVKNNVSERLVDIQKQQTIMLNEVKEIAKTTQAIQMDMVKVQATVDQNRRDLDSFNRKWGLNGRP